MIEVLISHATAFRPQLSPSGQNSISTRRGPRDLSEVLFAIIAEIDNLRFISMNSCVSIVPILACWLAPTIASGAILTVETYPSTEVRMLIFPLSGAGNTSLRDISSIHDITSLRKARVGSAATAATLLGLSSTAKPDPLDLQSASLDINRLLLSTGAFDQAEVAANELLLENPHSVQAILLRGVAKAGQGQHHEALADYDKLLKLGRDSAAVRQSRAVSLLALGRMDDAEANFSQAIALDPGFAQAYLKRGVLRGSKGKLEEAAADFSQYIDLRPESPVGYKNRAVALIKLGRHADAQPDIIRAQKLRQK